MIREEGRREETFEEKAAELLNAKIPSERVILIELLATIDGARAIPYLIAALRDDEKQVRNAAARSLGSIGESAVPQISALLTDQWWVIRYRACEALSMMENSSVYPYLQSALSDERDHVRYMAAKGLMNLRIPSAIPDLMPLLQDENPYVRAMAEKAINSMKMIRE
ncbi:MAG: HEAT repeat domain-containing protein [Methanocalculus sp.]|uniref:HEAT repeat domain-containing protein n=1 Tax=Methanocalculus sp. TaxID=2004547 RepID=UPI002727EF19|nr:HEAT repeat domain-containing protein [Methanocalculus sp.]MDO9538709.1 HEAT repeat domain-containing protein [Methanocalculus sp.]